MAKRNKKLKVSVSIPQTDILFLDEEAERLDISRSALICRAIDRERKAIAEQAEN